MSKALKAILKALSFRNGYSGKTMRATSILLLNLSLTGLVLLVITLILFISSPSFISKMVNERIWAETLCNDSSRKNHRLNFNQKYIYARTDAQGKLVEKAHNISMPDEHLISLIKLASDSQSKSGELTLDKENLYYFLKISIEKGQAATFIFADSTVKHKIIAELSIKTSVIILISLVLIFLGSLFISHRVLVPIKKAWQRQNEFAADASHELRTPLSIIRTNLDLVMDSPYETILTQKKWLENISYECRRMTRIVNDLLVLARADTNKILLDKTTFRMDCALDEVLMSFQPLASNKDIVIERHFKEDTIFFGDEERLKQLMVILVDNAIKYNSKGGKIDIVLKENVNSVEISVLDTGEGIEEEHQDKIFERFYRIDKARSRNEGGTGLGLAIAKWIVDEHNGSIKVYSVPGKGSRFRIILPNDKNKKYSNNFKSST